MRGAVTGRHPLCGEILEHPLPPGLGCCPGLFGHMGNEEILLEKEMDIRNRHFDPMRSDEWIQFISCNKLTSEELSWLYCCGLIWRELLLDQENLPVVTKAMLDCGMNPNQLVTDEIPNNDPENNYYQVPLIAATRIDNDLAAAESLKLLLEHGGDPNTVYLFEGSGEFNENVFEFYVEDEFVHGPDLDGRSFYGLLLCVAYGGKYVNGYMPFTMLTDEPVSVLRAYDQYWYEYVRENPSNPYSSTLYFIEKETGKRVVKW